MAMNDDDYARVKSDLQQRLDQANSLIRQKLQYNDTLLQEYNTYNIPSVARVFRVWVFFEEFQFIIFIDHQK